MSGIGMYVCMQVMVSGCVKIIGYLYEWHWYVCLYASYGEWVCEDGKQKVCIQSKLELMNQKKLTTITLSTKTECIC